MPYIKNGSSEPLELVDFGVTSTEPGAVVQISAEAADALAGHPQWVAATRDEFRASTKADSTATDTVNDDEAGAN